MCVYIRRRKNIEIEPSIIILHKKNHYTHIHTHRKKKEEEKRTLNLKKKKKTKRERKDKRTNDKKNF
jgi:hypothetical protein